MDIEKALRQEHSKNQALKIANYIDTSQERFDELMKYFFHDDWRLNQRAAYAMNFTVERNPFLFKKYLKKAVVNLRTPKHDAVKRNTLRILENIEIPEKLLGIVVDISFDFLASPKEPIAVKYFSMGILFKEAKKEPDLFHEIKVLIDDQMPMGSPGFRNKGQKILNYIAKNTDIE